MDPLGELPRGSLCAGCRRERFAVYAGVATEVCTAGSAEMDASLSVDKSHTMASELEDSEVRGRWEMSGDEVIALFGQFDKDGNGLIDKQDLAEVLMELKPSFWTNERLDLLLQQADKNGDGVIDYSEFVTWVFNTDPLPKAFRGQFRRTVTSLAHSADASILDESETLEVNASTLAGESCTVVVTLDTSVADLKQMVEANLGVRWSQQQLICGLEVLEPGKAPLKQFAGIARATSTPELFVIKIAPCTHVASIMLEEAGCEQVNGIYRRVNSNCYAKDHDTTICIFRYEASASWPAAWYIEHHRRHGIYYAVPDQTIGEGEEDDVDLDTQELGFPLPLSGWEPWAGYLSEPGQVPVPIVKPLEQET